VLYISPSRTSSWSVGPQGPSVGSSGTSVGHSSQSGSSCSSTIDPTSRRRTDPRHGRSEQSKGRAAYLQTVHCLDDYMQIWPAFQRRSPLAC